MEIALRAPLLGYRGARTLREVDEHRVVVLLSNFLIWLLLNIVRLGELYLTKHLLKA